jgi:hypothetical protein
VVFVTATLPDPDAPARLIGFQRVEVPAGGSAPIAIDVPRSRLATRDPARRRFVPPRGTHTVTVGRHVGDPQATSVTVRL